MWRAMRRADSRWLAGAALLLVAAIPVLAQDQPESILPPGFDKAPPLPAAPGTPADPLAAGTSARDSSPVDSAVVSSNSLTTAELGPPAPPPPPPAEYPSSIRRDPEDAGVFDAALIGLGKSPWGGARGKFLSVMMRRMDTPLASRWMHIGLRNALMVRGPAPSDQMASDFAAERAWLLLRLGEADGARLLVSSMDSDRFTPKMVQVAGQSALAVGDPSGLCAIESQYAKVEPRVAPLVRAMCESLSGSAESAAADIEQARRRGSAGGIDLALADKVVGAGADTARAATIEWQPVTGLNAWRYGLASATGLMPPERLMSKASATLRAWAARSPMFSAAARLSPARTAAALGVLGSDAYGDLYAAVYDATDPDDLGQSDAWKLRLAYVAKDPKARLDAMRSLWGKEAAGSEARTAAQVLTARAATLVAPDAALQDDAPDLIAAMLSAGFDRAAGRWKAAVDRMDDAPADRCWAMLALGLADVSGIDLGRSRIEDFADRDQSKDHQRTALLVAGLAGLGRIDGAMVARINNSYELGLGGQTKWSRLIDGAALRRQAGTVSVLAASGLQGRAFAKVPARYQYHGITALNRVGLDFLARMVAAEALART